MMPPPEELRTLRSEMRTLRQRDAAQRNAHRVQKARADRLEEKNRAQREEITQLEGKVATLETENTDLKIKLGVITQTAKKYAGMLFKTNMRAAPSGKTRGAQPEHQGTHRARPSRIDQTQRIFLTNCPECCTALKRTDSCDTRIVEDIPVLQTIVTQYEIERQWCNGCSKEVRGVPGDTLPGFSIGLNALVCILYLKYRLRAPLARIVDYLTMQHHLSLTQGGVVHLLHTFKKRFGPEYQRILQEIRLAPVKHADETSWRILGEKGWAWLFSTQKAAYYTIEETRGKGVPEAVLGPCPQGLLVRDDCPSYFSLPMPQQSCWTHLLRVSREETQKEGCSDDMKKLHTQLGELFGELDAANTQPFVMNERVLIHAQFLARIDAIIGRAYTHPDTLAVQIRIRNQRRHLIEALLHENASLTNNHAERMIRPMVVTRKISGGSQSDRGAETHAVNMSVMQTLALRGQSFFDGVRAIIIAGNPRYVAGNG